jgi:transposase-like protein
MKQINQNLIQIQKMSQKQYVKIDGIRCPYCGSDNIKGEDIEVDAGIAIQDVFCEDCDKSWSDTYKLTGYIPRD